MDKHDVAEILQEISVLLELQGENPFKIRAYRNAARAVENMSEDLDTVVREQTLKEIPGIGESIAEKITILVRRGSLPYLQKLKKSMPKGLVELLKVPGLGGKKVKALYKKLKISNVKELISAGKQGRIARLKGFGKKTQENILGGINQMKTYSGRLLWWDAMVIAEPILEGLFKLKDAEEVEVAGSLRRKLETVGDLDFIVGSDHPTNIMNWFIKQPWVAKVIAKGPTKASVRLKQGIQSDLRVVPTEQFAYALMYFTGSKEHNIQLRSRTNKRGFSLSEYGFEPLRRGIKPLVPKGSKMLTEADVYRSLGLDYIPPELRENMGEIEAAEKGKLPHLVEEKDIKGVFHCHTTDSDGHNNLEEMVAAAENLKFSYIGISDHSKSAIQAMGMNEEQLFAQIKRIQKINKSGKFSTYVFAGLECDILANGKLDFPDSVLKELDFVIVSVHRAYKADEKAMTDRIVKAIENPYATMVGHLTGRLLLRRAPYSVNVNKVIDACIANRKIIELNSHPNRLDMDWRYWHKAKEKGLKCSINPDAHHIQDLEYYKAGVNIARKGWLEKKDVLNTYSLKKVQDYLWK